MAEKISMVYDVVCNHLTHEEVARRLQIDRSTVSSYVRKVKQDPDLLDRLATERKQKEHKKEEICKYVCDLNNKGEAIDSTRSLQR